MDHVYLEEHQIVERYLMGKLPAAQQARFEEHYLACPECLDRLEVAGRFHHALKGVATEETAKAAFVTRIGIFGVLARSGRAPQAALLAVLTVLILLPSGLLLRSGAERDHLAEDLRQAHGPQEQIAFLRLGPERSGPGESEPASRITLTGDPEWIVLSLEGAAEGWESCRATLLAPDGETAWQSAALARDPTGAFVLSVHSSFLEVGSYVLRLEGASARGEVVPVARFSFRVFR